MKRLHTLIKPASSLCNMRCVYCFYTALSARRDVPSRGIMTRETAARIIGNVFSDLDDGDEVHFAFQGGEPTLAGLPWFRDFSGMAADRGRGRRLGIHYALQTNGLLLDDEWCAFLKERRFLVGLSLDGGESRHNRYRPDSRGRGTYGEVLRRKELLDAHSVDYNILCVLTNDLASDPDRVWRFILREKIGYIQFIPCLDDPGSPGSSSRALRPPRFASFYTRLFHLWREELAGGRYISVKFFDDVANLFFRHIPTACGIAGQCQAQYVVESDGGVYPCDFYALDGYLAGNLGETALHEIFDSPRMRAFLDEKPPLPGICGTCAYRPACGGGCKRMRNVMYAGAEGALCGYRAFLDRCLEPLEQAVRPLLS